MSRRVLESNTATVRVLILKEIRKKRKKNLRALFFVNEPSYWMDLVFFFCYFVNQSKYILRPNENNDLIYGST